MNTSWGKTCACTAALGSSRCLLFADVLLENDGKPGKILRSLSRGQDYFQNGQEA